MSKKKPFQLYMDTNTRKVLKGLADKWDCFESEAVRRAVLQAGKRNRVSE